MLPKVFNKVLGADELSCSLFSFFLFVGAICWPFYVAHAELLGLFPSWRGEREWFPVSNPVSCRAVDMRED